MFVKTYSVKNQKKYLMKSTVSVVLVCTENILNCHGEKQMNIPIETFKITFLKMKRVSGCLNIELKTISQRRKYVRT